jgi:transcription antitermination factor NusG
MNDNGGLKINELQKGDAISIGQGPFAGYDAIFDSRLSGEKRVQVLLQWLGREVKVTVAASAVEKRRRPKVG